MARECSTLASAWKVTVNNALASAYVLYCVETQRGARSSEANTHDVKPGNDELHVLFKETAEAISAGTLAKTECRLLYDWLVRRHGYQFARELFVKSSVKESVALAKASPEERRAGDRYTKAWNGSELPDDHVRYWKQVSWLSLKTSRLWMAVH